MDYLIHIACSTFVSRLVLQSKTQNIDTYFASYLPESEKYSNEVATIAYKLGTMGYKVVFDQIDSVRVNEKGFNMWVDEQILAAKKYIVFCSPGYVRLWQSLVTNAPDNKLSHVNKEDLVRVRYEIKRISDVYSENCSTKQRYFTVKTGLTHKNKDQLRMRRARFHNEIIKAADFCQ
ncbi:hypothetical protein QZH41_006817 [Actinostola sp. cb2023]|nr:hypothetical protein QZH41_006817 [Actinostola sp. cb2023]